MTLAPTNKAADITAAKAAENESWRLCDIVPSFPGEKFLGYDRSRAADSGTDADTHKNHGGENCGHRGGDIVGDIGEHFDFLST
jgi:hypothetical protein